MLLCREHGLKPIFIGTILTATSITITTQTLLELNKLRSKANSAILGAEETQ